MIDDTEDRLCDQPLCYKPGVVFDMGTSKAFCLDHAYSDRETAEDIVVRKEMETYRALGMEGI